MTQQPINIQISNLAGCEQAFKSYNPNIVFSLLDPGLIAPTLRSRGLVAHHIYRLWDTEDEVDSKLRFVVKSLCEASQLARRELGDACRFLVHCNAGASRSTAAAYVIISALLGSGSEEVAFARLLQLTNKPWPNSAIVKEADRLLGRRGQLSAVLDRYRLANPGRLGAYVRLNRRRGIVRVDVPDASPIDE